MIEMISTKTIKSSNKSVCVYHQNHGDNKVTYQKSMGKAIGSVNKNIDVKLVGYPDEDEEITDNFELAFFCDLQDLCGT